MRRSSAIRVRTAGLAAAALVTGGFGSAVAFAQDEGSDDPRTTTLTSPTSWTTTPSPRPRRTAPVVTATIPAARTPPTTTVTALRPPPPIASSPPASPQPAVSDPPAPPAQSLASGQPPSLPPPPEPPSAGSPERAVEPTAPPVLAAADSGAMTPSEPASLNPGARPTGPDGYRPPARQHLRSVSRLLDAALSRRGESSGVYQYGALREIPLRGGGHSVRASQRSSLLTYPWPEGGERMRPTGRAGVGLPDLDPVLGRLGPVEASSGARLSFGRLPLLALVLVLASALLLVGALLPPRLLERAGVPRARCARVRQTLAVVAIGVLLPVAVGSLAIGLS